MECDDRANCDAMLSTHNTRLDSDGFLFASILIAQVFYRRRNLIPRTRRIRVKIGIPCIHIVDSLSLFTIAIYETLFQGFPYAVDFVYPLTLCLAMAVLTAPIVSCRNYGIVTSGGLFIGWLVFTLSAIPDSLDSEEFKEYRSRRREDSHLCQGRRRTSFNDNTPLLHDQTNDDYGSVPTSQPILKLPSIIWTLFVMFKWDVMTAMDVKILPDILLFCNPMLLKSWIRFTEQLERPMWQGVAMALTMFILAELSSFLLPPDFFSMCGIGTRLQAHSSIAKAARGTSPCTLVDIDSKNVLTPEIIFVSSTLFNQLRFPMSQIADLIPQRLKESLTRDNSDMVNVNDSHLSLLITTPCRRPAREERTEMTADRPPKTSSTWR